MRVAKILTYPVISLVLLMSAFSPAQASGRGAGEGVEPLWPICMPQLLDNPPGNPGNSPSFAEMAVVSPQCGPNIPQRMLLSSGRVNIGRFSVRAGNQTYREPNGNGWYISRDRAGHGGSAWKLLDSRLRRVASLDGQGNILRR